MEELSYSAKIAVIKILREIMNADNVVDENELKYMDEVVESFALDDNYMDEVNNLLTLQALATIREQTIPQKEMVAKMMGNMIVCDNDINYNEVKLYNAFCESCNIERDFNIEEYPDVSLSGPFANPEDLMNNL